MRQRVLLTLIGVALTALVGLAWAIRQPIADDPPRPAENSSPVSRPPAATTPAPHRSGGNLWGPSAIPTLPAVAADAQQRPPADASSADAPLAPRRRPGFLGGDRGPFGAGLRGPSMERFGERRPVDPAVSLQMDEANQFYAQAQYAEASARAKAVLEGQPDNPRMLRVVVSSACMMGASAEAATYFNRLTNPRDRDQMTRRCREAGIELP